MTDPIVAVSLLIDDQEVQVMPSPEHEYLMTTEQVALGYGASQENIRTHKATKRDELLEGKHWITVGNPNGGADLTLWTKRGVIRLGFFIRSKRARKFRDMAEDLVLNHLAALPVPALPAAPALDLSALQQMADLMPRAIEARVAQSEQKILAQVDARFAAQPISGTQKRDLYDRTRQLGQRLGGTPNHYRKAWSELKDRYHLASYGDLPANQFEDAMRFVDGLIAAYTPAPALNFEGGRA